MRDDESIENTEGAVAVATEPEVPQVPEDGSPVTSENPENQAVQPVQAVQPEGAEAVKPTESTGPTAEEITAAVEKFMISVDAAVEQRDTASGDLPEAALAPVKVEYSNLPATSAKTRARTLIENKMKDALGKDLDAVKARAYMLLGGAVKATGSTHRPVATPPADPTQAFVDRVTAMYLSPNLVTVPDGVADNWAALVQARGEALKSDLSTYKQYLIDHDEWQVAHDKWTALTEAPEGDEGNKPPAPVEPKEPEVAEVIRTAAKIARGRSAGRAGKTSTPGAPKVTKSGPAYDGPKRSTRAHIESAFANVPSGTWLKVAEICAHNSAEYGDDHPSGGAVGAALWPPSGGPTKVQGVTPELVNGIKGARKN